MASILRVATSAFTLTSTLLTFALVFSAGTTQSSGQCSINDLETSYPGPVAADGWAYRLIASDLSQPRGILFNTEDALLVVEQGTGLVHLEFEDQGQTCLPVRRQTTLLENEGLTHGIALSEDGRTLYASTQRDVYSWPYDPSGPSLSTTSRRTLVTNMGNPGSHSTRTLLLSRNHPDILVVSRGSDENEDDGALDRSTGISQIRAFNICALINDDDSYDYTDGDLLGWGLRNSVGVGEHPETGGIWSVENSVDGLSPRGRDIHADNPAEELNFHGYLNGSDANLGGNYGYPLCYRKLPKSGRPRDRLGNREVPVGYDVSYVSFDNRRPSAPQDSTNATISIIYNIDLSNCPSDCFRPVGLAWDSTGRLWLSSDSTGEIFVLNYEGNDSSDEGDNDGNGRGGRRQ
ncbi:Hypothetical protein NCS54_00638700 [Fusarium falciforme]|uniref:Hypothetical protein n=1 Tax=Fusarium falciforme TaxID=195108 RepID=UPI0022FFC89C|nr:Hypothetical protein NCS54_00638700 [Fusarium falciforme]WAO89015.1 Hypothetical protein NCS54_00638700 [Fusarium falciforme]